MRSLKFFAFLFSGILFTTACNGWKPWSSSSTRANDMFCFVIRTYWGHGGKENPAGLRRLLKSIQQQQAQRWEAVLIVADSRPFPDLQQIVMEHNDTRIWVFAEWIGNEFAPKTAHGAWVPGYHELLYNLTDDAIQVCPPDTKWLVVTNGDNEYGASFTTQVTDITTSKSSSNGKSPDIVAFDFYSRYQRPTAPPCDRFHAWPGIPACKLNKLSWCQTDLGANAISFPKFMQEARMFGSLHQEAGGLGADHFDGILAETLVAAGWKVARVTSKCLFSHSPNPQECAWSGGVWDDSDVQGTGGGRCIDWGEREKMLTADQQLFNGEGQLEEVIVTVSSDGNITSEFQSSNSNNDNNWDGQLRCLRKRMYNSEAERNAQRAWFSSRCADEETGDLQEQTRWEAEVWPLYSIGQLPYQQQQQQAAAAAAIGEGGSVDQHHHQKHQQQEQQQQQQQRGEVELAQHQQQQEAQIGVAEKGEEQQQQHTQSVHHQNVPPTVATPTTTSSQQQQQLDRDPTVPESWFTLQAEFRSIFVGQDGVPIAQRRAQYVVSHNNIVGEVREPFTTPPSKTM